jgi:hypothetical protein
MVKDAFGKGAERVSAWLAESSTSVDERKPTLEKERLDYSSLVVSRRDGNQIGLRQRLKNWNQYEK